MRRTRTTKKEICNSRSNDERKFEGEKSCAIGTYQKERKRNAQILKEKNENTRVLKDRYESNVGGGLNKNRKKEENKRIRKKRKKRTLQEKERKRRKENKTLRKKQF